MNLINRALSVLRMKSTVVQPLSLTSAEGWRVPGSMTDAGEAISESSALGLSSVFGCVNLLAGTVASLPFMTYRRGENGRKIEKGHPLHRLLHESPNFEQTALDFWEYMQASLELWGNAYARIIRQGGRVVALRPANPALVMVKRKTTGALEYVWTEEGRRFELEETQVLHIRGFGGAPLGGMSTLHFARNAFGIARATDRAAGRTFQNGMRPTGAITFADWLTNEQHAIAKTRLTEEYLGAENTGKPLILEGGTKWEQLTVNPEDAQMLESRRFSVEEICRFFGVPPHMIGHTENSTSWGTGLEQQTLGFVKFTLRRRLRRIEQAVMKQLLTPDERAAGLYCEFSIEGLLRGDSASRASFYQSGLSNGWMTINEVRALENLAPVDGGDVPRMQMQNVPITEAGKDNSDA